MFGEEADCLGSGFEKELRDLAKEPGQQRAKFRPDFFEAAGHCFSGRFQSIGYRADNRPNCDARGKKDSSNSNAVFFENLFDLFSQRHSVFSFRDLTLQTRELFVSFFYPYLCSFSF